MNIADSVMQVIVLAHYLVKVSFDLPLKTGIIYIPDRKLPFRVVKSVFDFPAQFFME